MPGQVTLAQLATRVRRRAGMENSLFVSAAEVEEYVEQSLGALYDIVLECAGPDFWQEVSSDTVTTAGNPIYIPLTGGNAVQIYRVIGVDVLWEGTWRKISPYQAGNELQFEDLNGWEHWTRVWYRTQFSGHPDGPIEVPAEALLSIVFRPTPLAAHTFRVRYVPIPADWSSAESGEVFQGFSGWDEWIVCDAAAKCLEKEESFEQAMMLLSRRDKREEQIRWAASTMNLDRNKTVRDINQERRLGPRRSFS